MAMLPMAMFGLEVPPGDVAIPAATEIRSAFRITMAAIDPSAEPEGEEGQPPRATLKVIRQALMDDDDEDDSDDGFDQAQMERLLRDEASDESEESDEEDAGMNGGPSDPEKRKMAKRAAKIKEVLAAEGMDVDEDEDESEEAIPNGVNGTIKSTKAKGKQPASDSDEDEDEDDLDDEDAEIEEFVICTLDPNKLYQQTLDITFGEDEAVFFKVSGTHSIFLTGNYVAPAGDPDMYDPDSDEDEEYDLEPDMDEIDEDDMDAIDELDDMEDPRITEVDEDEVEAPALIKASTNGIKTNKNKRPAPESADEEESTAGAVGLDEMMMQDIKGTQAAANGEHNKLSKKERKELKKQDAKKLKKNDGSAAAAPVTAKEEKKDADAPSSTKSDKKVSFAKELEQGPTPTKAPEKSATTTDPAKSAAKLGVKTVQGVTIDDKKLGAGQAAKSGDRVGMRYIGKLTDGKVFDSNKKGKPFSFKLGAGEVIKGWDVGVQGMQVGAERRITVPAHLAYGKKGAGGDIPPNATLVFDLKVLSIDKK